PGGGRAPREIGGHHAGFTVVVASEALGVALALLGEREIDEVVRGDHGICLPVRDQRHSASSHVAWLRSRERSFDPDAAAPGAVPVRAPGAGCATSRTECRSRIIATGMRVWRRCRLRYGVVALAASMVGSCGLWR